MAQNRREIVILFWFFFLKKFQPTLNVDFGEVELQLWRHNFDVIGRDVINELRTPCTVPFEKNWGLGGKFHCAMNCGMYKVSAKGVTAGFHTMCPPSPSLSCLGSRNSGPYSRKKSKLPKTRKSHQICNASQRWGVGNQTNQFRKNR